MQDDGSIILETEVAGTDEIRFCIMSWGSGAEVLSLPSLRDEIKEETEMMAGRYEPVSPIMGEESPPYDDRAHERPLQRNWLRAVLMRKKLSIVSPKLAPPMSLFVNPLFKTCTRSESSCL